MHVKDMAGLLTPSASYELISALKKALKIPVHQEIKEYCHGMYGMPPGKISDELMQKAIGSETPDFKRPGELLAPGIEPARQGCAGLARVWEDVLTYALFPNEATEFLKIKYGA